MLLSSSSGQEEAMMGHLVEHGPLAVVVDAVSWQDYLGGVIQYHCSSKWANHAVLVVGYDTAGTYSRCRAFDSIITIMVGKFFNTQQENKRPQLPFSDARETGHAGSV